MVPGFDFTSATNSCTFFAAMSGGETSTSGTDANLLTPVSSRISNGKFLFTAGAMVCPFEQTSKVYPSGAGLRDRRGAGKPRTVVDDHLLVPGLRKLVGDGAREPVRDAAGTEVHDNADRLVRKFCASCADRRRARRAARCPHSAALIIAPQCASSSCAEPNAAGHGPASAAHCAPAMRRGCIPR